MLEATQAILPPDAQERTVVWHDGAAIAQAGLLFQSQVLADALPERDYVINACSSRYAFLVAFLAALLRDQVTILPNDRSPRVAASLSARFPKLYCLSDEAAPMEGIETHPVTAARPKQSFSGEIPSLPRAQRAVIVFTSGSTGAPSPHEKSLELLATTGRLIAARFNLAGPSPAAILATVPPQHMYGLETSIVLPLWAGASVHSARPLYPADVAAALAGLSAPRVLVTTPIHLNALIKADTALPPLQMVISATAPLLPQLARQVEQRYDTEVHEIFGFSEAGTVATRRTLEGPLWHTCDGLRLRQDAQGCSIDAPHFPAPVPMNDLVRVLSPETFELQGRSSDTINIAGKRASLSGLNAILAGMEGVADGAFYLGDEDPNRVTRLLAFVVAPERSGDDIKAALRREIDPAFLPRHLYLVPRLPRSETGKLPRSALADLAEQMKSNSKK